jgi:hypothetical protein
MADGQSQEMGCDTSPFAALGRRVDTALPTCRLLAATFELDSRSWEVDNNVPTVTTLRSSPTTGAKCAIHHGSNSLRHLGRNSRPPGDLDEHRRGRIATHPELLDIDWGLLNLPDLRRSSMG